MKETILINEFHESQQITGFYVIRKKEIKTKRDGAPFLHLELGDSSGRISANAWDNVSDLNRQIHQGEVVKVRGRVILYNENLQLNIEKIRKTDSDEKIVYRQFVPKGDIDTNVLNASLNSIIETVQNRWLRQLLDLFYGDSEWLQAFRDAPGGKLWHHAYLGGLLEHTVTVANTCISCLSNYQHLDRDLTVTAALLHDIGKIEEYRYDQGYIEYSDAGRLMGHISIGAQQVQERMKSIEGFPENVKLKLIHLLLSHQGELSHGSPVVPLMPEAMILYYADEMDSKVNALQHVQKRDHEPGRHWSQWVPVLDRFIYLGEDFSASS